MNKTEQIQCLRKAIKKLSPITGRPWNGTLESDIFSIKQQTTNTEHNSNVYKNMQIIHKWTNTLLVKLHNITVHAQPSHLFTYTVINSMHYILTL